MKRTFKVFVLNFILILIGNDSFAGILTEFISKFPQFVKHIPPQNFIPGSVHSSFHNLNNPKSQSKFLAMMCMKCEQPKIADFSKKGMNNLFCEYRDDCKLSDTFYQNLHRMVDSAFVSEAKDINEGVIFEAEATPSQQELEGIFEHIEPNMIIEGKGMHFEVPESTSSGYYTGISMGYTLTSKILFSFYIPKEKEEELKKIIIDNSMSEEDILQEVANSSQLSNAYPVE